MSELQKSSFNAVFDANSRILILGSLPGDASLNAGHYYAHPRNAFWHIISQLIAVDLTQRPFAERYTLIKQHGIALWDVVQQASRVGSLDAAIQTPQFNPLDAWCRAQAQLQLVAFNGQAAAKYGSKLIPGYIEQVVLPSSSPAYTLNKSHKTKAWLTALSPYLKT
ncbi:DNA-deoxyinosine glycosylase [Deefgea piscis]|uniref:DNA-deoxyinosine glycosylase n=1 Tax=Deefgea piscis TaxID=2739061 RepID=UPI001C824D1F|nr:DNA-deoxyinosine glycosylase [Deefgea piscis]QZA79575.1 DNA-deoxyinosine glycosylase [Deefgea piscis]